MRAVLPVAVVLAISSAIGLSLSRAADDAEPKYTIKEVMKLAHKDGLMKKVASGDGTKEDAEKLLELYTALGENKPPKGDAADWKERTDALIQAAQDAVDGKEGAGAELQKAANCAACHKAHKPA